MNSTSSLTSGRLLARNTLLNLAGEAAPFMIAVVAIPVLIHGVGVDRYGVLTLVMLAVGYFGVFNFGLGRAATKFIAETAASGNHTDIPGLFWTALFLMFGFGVCGAILVAVLSPWLVSHVLKIAPALQDESLDAFYLLAVSLPFVISAGSLGGTLSAFQRFDLINAVRVPAGALYYTVPLLVLPFSHSLVWIVAAIVLVRLASWTAHFALCLYILPELRQEVGPRREVIRPMLNFGGWVTISGIVLPIMEYADRFIIGAMLSVAAVSYYAVPYQITNKLRVISTALSGVVFPAFSGSFAVNPARSAVLFERAARYILLAVFPLALVIITLAPEGLALWIGPSFARHGATTLRWLALGMFVNSLAWMPYLLLQAAHRPDLTAKLSMAEFPCFVLLLWWILPRYGVAGAAAAFSIRSVADAIVLFSLARRVSPNLIPIVVKLTKIALMAILVLVLGMLPMTTHAKGMFITAMLGLYMFSCATVLLEQEERQFAREYLRAARTTVIGLVK